MSDIVGAKNYYGLEMENVILRPLSEQLSEVKTLLNYPSNKHCYWKRDDLGLLTRNTFPVSLEDYSYNGEYEASDYFTYIYDYLIKQNSNFSDVTGVELEMAEIKFLIDEIASDIRRQMWHSENGFINQLIENDSFKKIKNNRNTNPLDLALQNIKERRIFKDLKFYVSFDVYKKNNLFEKYKGIPVINCGSKGLDFVLLTDFNNLVLNLNNADPTKSEVKLWYNPDVMANKQRVRFKIGYNILNPFLTSLIIK